MRAAATRPQRLTPKHLRVPQKLPAPVARDPELGVGNCGPNRGELRCRLARTVEGPRVRRDDASTMNLRKRPRASDWERRPRAGKGERGEERACPFSLTLGFGLLGFGLRPPAPHDLLQLADRHVRRHGEVERGCRDVGEPHQHPVRHGDGSSRLLRPVVREQATLAPRQQRVRGRGSSLAGRRATQLGCECRCCQGAVAERSAACRAPGTSKLLVVPLAARRAGQASRRAGWMQSACFRQRRGHAQEPRSQGCGVVRRSHQSMRASFQAKDVQFYHTPLELPGLEAAVLPPRPGALPTASNPHPAGGL